MDDTRGDARPSTAEEAWALLLKLQESGTAPDFETWVREYPEFEAELRRLHSEWEQVDDQLEQAFAASTGPDSPFLTSLAEAQAAGAVEVAPGGLRPGLRVGEFRLLRRIAEGGMGQVWEAEQPALGRRVALKFIRPDRVDQRAVELFEREARAGGRVSDPRIVTVHAMGETGGLRWIAQEHVAGERTLLDWLAEARELPRLTPGWYRRIAAFFAEVAEAMAAAHAVGVIHRDLKPQNILVTTEGRPKVTDFGLARLQDESSLSGEISMAGTTRYMSPEQVAGKLLGIDERTDVFSLGAVLYELLTLKRPFDGETTVEIFGRITLHDPAPPREVRPEVPAELGVIALKALEKRPRDRYASMAELAADLRRWLAHEPIRARPPGALQRAAKWCRRHPTATVATTLGSAFVIAGVLVAGQVRESRRELEKQKLTNEVVLAIEDGRIDLAAEIARELLELDPHDYRAHLLLAMGFARFLRFGESEEALAAAMALGFDPEGELGQEPQELSEQLYLRALYLIAQHDRASEEEAERLLRRALETDRRGRFDHSWFPLYQVRKALGDIDGAAEALDEFAGSLKGRNADLRMLAQALRADLLGDTATAIEQLEALRASVDADRMVELRAWRHLGRNYVLRFEQTGRTDFALLDRAEADLRREVEGLEDDSPSWALLGLVDLLRASAEPDEARRDDLLASAERNAASALEFDASHVMALEVQVDVARLRITAGEGFDAERADEALLDELDRRLEVLEDLDPESAAARGGRSDLLYFRGAIALERGDQSRARELFEESAWAYEHQLRARVMLAERIYLEGGDRRDTLELLLEARRIWQDGIPSTNGGPPRHPWEARWGLTLDVWTFLTSDQVGELDLARETRDCALEWVDSGREPDEVEYLNLAEALAIPAHAELLDCERARDLVERYDLQRHFERERDGGALGILASIRAACGD